MSEFDYETWAPTTKDTLIEKGLWEVVKTGVPPYPLKIPNLSPTVKASKLSIWRDLVLKDMKSIQVILSSLPNSTKKRLTFSSGKELWDLLCRTHEEAKVVRLEKEFKEMSIRVNESPDSYFDRVDGVVEELRGLRVEVSDFEFMEKILGSNDCVVSLLKELYEVHNVTFESLVEYLFTHGHGFESVNEEVLLKIINDLKVKSQAEEYRKKQGKPRKGVCFQCGGRGHKAKDCIRVEEEEEEEEEEEIVEMVALDDTSYDEDMWMVSRYATVHMTRHLKFFTALDRRYKAKVGLVDGSVLVAEGRGDVKIVMKEGKKKTIGNVLYVPGISRNVLSIGQMECRGYSFSEGKGGECKIRDRIGAEFGEAMWVGKEVALRLRVIEGNLAS